MIPRSSLRQRPLRALAKALASPAAAGGAALVVCGWTRSSHSFPAFPVGGESWELLFDPVASALLAAATAFVLALVHLAVPDKGDRGPRYAGAIDGAPRDEQGGHQLRVHAAPGLG